MKRIAKRVVYKALSLMGDERLAGLARMIGDQNPGILAEVLGPHLNRDPDLKSTSSNFDPGDRPGFDQLAWLFASTPLNHGVIHMTVREAAYVFGLVRNLGDIKALEIGRYKGGGTLLLACAMSRDSELWSIDIGEKEHRLKSSGPAYDDQLRRVLGGICTGPVHLVVGDSRSTRLDRAAPLDLVVFDGDHSYEGVRADYLNFREGMSKKAHLLFHDAYDFSFFRSHSDTVGRLVEELIASKEYVPVARVDSMAHIQRVD